MISPWGIFYIADENKKNQLSKILMDAIKKDLKEENFQEKKFKVFFIYYDPSTKLSGPIVFPFSSYFLYVSQLWWFTDQV